MVAGAAPAPLSEDDLAALEALVQSALASGPEELEVLAHGEISCVLAWKGFACKRLPPLDSRSRFEAYRAVFESYLARLAEASIATLPSEVRLLQGAGGSWTAYCVQPKLRRDLLLPEVLRQATEEEARPRIGAVLAAIRRCPPGRIGLDAQLSNWGVSEQGDLLYLDLTTPLLRDEAGREALDIEIFVSALPAVARGLVRRFLAREILDRYYDHRSVALDLVANLYNQGLERLAPLCLDLAGPLFSPRLTLREAQAYWRADARIWKLVRRLLSLERFWHRTVLRRSFPVLLPHKP